MSQKKIILFSILIFIIGIFIYYGFIFLMWTVFDEIEYKERVKFEETICKDISFNIENIKCIKKENNLAEITFTLVNNGVAIENVYAMYTMEDEYIMNSLLLGINKTAINTGESKLIGPIEIDRYSVSGFEESIEVAPIVKYDNEFGEEDCSYHLVKERFECV